jgi:hypothetical protein
MPDKMPGYINPYTDFGLKKLLGERANGEDFIVEMQKEL